MIDPIVIRDANAAARTLSVLHQLPGVVIILIGMDGQMSASITSPSEQYEADLAHACAKFAVAMGANSEHFRVITDEEEP